MIRLSVQLFGYPQLLIDNSPIKVERRKTLALVIYLAVETAQKSPSNRTLPTTCGMNDEAFKCFGREALATFFWPDYPSDKAGSYLRQAIWDFSKSAGEEWLVKGKQSVGLNPDAPVWIDVNEFRELYAQLNPRLQQQTTSTATLTHLTDLYQGDFLTGFSLPDSPDFDDWQALQAESLRMQFSHILGELVDRYSAQHQFELGIQHSLRWLSLDPLNETCHRILMQLYEDNGQRNSALQQYESCASLMKKELGIEPSPETVALYQRMRSKLSARTVLPHKKLSDQAPPPTISGTKRPSGTATFTDLGEKPLKDLALPERNHQVNTSGLPGQFTPSESIDVPVKRLPAQTTSFIGREAELTEIEVLLASPDCRFITLMGIGGSGKTRLAIQAAHQSQAWKENIYFIRLEGINTRQSMLAAIADAVNQTGKTNLPGEVDLKQTQDWLLAYLARQKVLLILDNFEQLTGCADVLTDLLSAAPHVKLIVTSQERLNLPNEWVLPVEGLAYPGMNELHNNIAQYPAARLFLHTAERTSGFIPTESDWPVIARICQLLEGLPLGIEMAAAWVKMISCQEIVQELEKDLDLLSSSWRGLPERHRTIRAVFDYSWGLLTGHEKQVFSALSWFKGGFTREATMFVTGATLNTLSILIDKSMVRRQSSGRYEIHPLLSRFAAEKLASNPEWLNVYPYQYANYYCDWISRLDNQLKGRSQLEALNLLRSDSKNLFAVWQWLVKQCNYERLIQILPAYLAYYEYHNRFSETAEIAQLLREMIQWLEPECGENEDDWVKAPHADLLSLSLAALRHFRWYADGLEAMLLNHRKSLRIAQVLPDNFIKALILLMDASGPGDILADEAIRISRQSLEIFKRQQDTWGAAMATLVLADNTFYGAHDSHAAWDFYQSSLAIFKEAGNDWGVAKCLVGLADIKSQEGQFAAAYGLELQSVRLLERLNTRDAYFFGLMHLAEFAVKSGQYSQARQHYEILLAYFNQTGDVNNQQLFLDKLSQLENLI